MSKDVLKLALAALECKDGWGSSIRSQKDRAITAIKQALEQPAPVHFAWMRYEADCAGDPVLVLSRSTEEGAFKVYKEPPTAQPATEKSSAVAAPVQPVDIATLVEGMEVSIDVSTGEHDSGNRLFGSVTLVQQNQGSKHSLILLVQEPEANFKTASPPAAAVQEIVAWMYELIIDGEVCNVECTNVNWNPEYQPFGRAGIDFVEGGKVTKTPLYTTPPAAQRPWVGLTDERVRQLCGSVPSMKAAVREAEAELKEKNT